jgi:hypothetical protein
MLTKLSDRGSKCIFVGIPPGTKGWTLWDPVSKKEKISRNVTFRESIPGGSILINSTPSVDVSSNDPIGDVEDDASFNNDPVVSLEDDPVSISSDAEAGGEVDDGVSSSSALVDRPVRSSRGVLPRHFDEFLMQADAGDTTDDEPVSYHSAINGIDSSKWLEAMEVELNQLTNLNVWENVKHFPSTTKPIKARWIFKIKRNPDNSVDKYKARLVAKGFTQRKGVEYNETYSPTVPSFVYRILLKIAAQRKYKFKVIDFTAAFLNAPVEELIIVQLPDGRLVKLLKSLYGIKQAPRNWNTFLCNILSDLKLVPSPDEPCLFNSSTGPFLAVCFHVDDLLCVYEDEETFNWFSASLRSKYAIVIRDIKHGYLGMKVSQDNDGNVSVSSPQYIDKVLAQFNMSGCIGASYPNSGVHLHPRQEGETVFVGPYRELVGSLMYLANTNRPDIVYSVNCLARYSSSPSTIHWNAAKLVLRYLSSTKHLRLTFKADNSIKVLAYSDADWAGDVSDRCSTSGSVIFLGSTPVLWASKKQTCVALSSHESEYVAGGVTAPKLIAVSNVVNGMIPTAPIPLMRMDNKSAIHSIVESSCPPKAKHIAVKYHFIRKLVADKEINIEFVRGVDNIADIFTKPLTGPKFKKFSSFLVGQ